MFANCAHSAGESSPGNLSPGTYAIALGVPDEPTLKRVADNLEALGQPVHRVVESHGQYREQLMALGIPPGPKSQVGRYLTNLKLISLTNLQEWRDNVAWWSKQVQAQLNEQSALRLQVHELKCEAALTLGQRISRWWRK
jgi:hypothetical protein